jgi:hypothetical protein
MSTTRWARIGFSLVAWLVAFGALIQTYLAGTAIANLGGNPANFEMHRNFGYIFGILTIVLVVLALAGRMPRKVVVASLLLLAMMVGQSVLVFIRVDQPNIAALHPVNGFLIVLLAFWVAWATLRYIRAPLPLDLERDREHEREAARQAELGRPPMAPPDEPA